MQYADLSTTFYTSKHMKLIKDLFLQLARAVGVPVGWCLGGRLATILVATLNDIISPFFSPPMSTFLIEGVLGSKNLFGKS